MTVEFIAARSRDLGGFTVRRTLPAAARRMVGPFTFWDHMGPVALQPGHGMDVRPHPHINLATITYLLDGAPLGKRYIWWNFVSSSEERIERKKREWQEGAFPKLSGDDKEYIPLP